MPNTLKLRLKALPVAQKIILIGSFLAFIGAFLPWYQDIDRFKTGDMFLGITGPLYLAGLIVLVAAVISFGIVALRLFEKPLPKLPLKENEMHIFNSSISFLMIILASSVYFHTKFGISLTDKSMGIGMMLAILGAALVMTGGILVARKKSINFEDIDGDLKPLINLNQSERTSGGIEKNEEMGAEDLTKNVPEKHSGSVNFNLDNAWGSSGKKDTNDLR